jgi:hypothetical protein
MKTARERHRAGEGGAMEGSAIGVFHVHCPHCDKERVAVLLFVDGRRLECQECKAIIDQTLVRDAIKKAMYWQKILDWLDAMPEE